VSRGSFFLSQVERGALYDKDQKPQKPPVLSKEVTLEKQLLPHFLTISDNNNKILAVKTRAQSSFSPSAAVGARAPVSRPNFFSRFPCSEFQSGP